MTRKPRAAKPKQMDLVREAGLSEGVHLHLPEERYFEARALGSSDLSTLAKDPASWWYASDYNTARRVRVRRSPQLVFGSALHARLLEGEAAFRSRFVVEPDEDSGQYLRTPSEVRNMLIEAGHAQARKLFTAGELHQLARKAGLAHRVWDLAWGSYEHAKKVGQRHITADEERRLQHMARLVEAHGDLGPGLRKGLVEVSVFWRREDDPATLLRARFDLLQKDKVVDLKTMGNASGKDPDDATFDAIAENDYDLQAEHYREAREKLAAFVRAGQVFSWGVDGQGGKVLPAERDLLEAAAATQRWVWLWIFYQVRNDAVGSERAPVLVPWFIEPTDELFTRARPVIETALANFRTYRDRHGLAEGWSEVRPIRPLPVDRLGRLNFKRRSAP